MQDTTTEQTDKHAGYYNRTNRQANRILQQNKQTNKQDTTTEQTDNEQDNKHDIITEQTDYQAGH